MRPEYVRGELYFKDGRFGIISTGKQISSRLNSMVNANCLLILPGKKAIKFSFPEYLECIVIENKLFTTK